MILLDTNVVIYAANPDYPGIRAFVDANDEVAVSAITYVEALGYHGLTVRERSLLERFFAITDTFPLDHAVLEKAVELRQRRKLALGDSLGAATALVHGVALATCDVRGFRWIGELELIPLDAG